MKTLSQFVNELKRRRMIKGLAIYLGVAWLALQVVSVLSGMLSISNLVGIAILIAFVTALPLFLYLTWHFDFSLNGITRTASLDATPNQATSPLGKVTIFGLLFILVASIAIGIQLFNIFKDSTETALESEYLTKQEIEKSDSIAVLPFEDLSITAEQGYLAVGLSEEITNQLGRTNLFRVSASRSSQVLVEKGFNSVEIGKRLNVQTVMKGKVTVTNQRLSVFVELQDIKTEKILWTETFDREFENIFDIESEVSRSVVNVLQDRYTAAGDLLNLSTTSNIDAYVLYLKGKEAYRKQTAESMQEARTYFEESISVDPEYAQAYVSLADTLSLLSEGADGFGVLSVEIAAELAQQMLEKAYSREPNLPEFFAVNGSIFALKGEHEKAILEFDKATNINPNLAIAYMWKSLSLSALQRYEEAIEEQQKSQTLDPLFLTSSYNLGVLLSWQARYEEAEALFSQLELDFPESPFAHIGAANLYYSQGDFVGSIREWKKAVELSPSDSDIEQKMLDTLSMLGMTDIIQAKSNAPRYDSTILIFEKRYEELFEKLAFEVAANPDDYWVAFEAGWNNSMFGEAETAAQLLTLNEETISDADKFYMPYCSPAIEMAWAHSVLGNEDKSLALLKECEALLETQRQNSIAYSEVDYLAARIYALKGENSAAALSLQNAIDKGWREWWTVYDPLLKDAQNDPNISEVILFIKDDLARQKELALSLFNSDN